MANQAVPTPIKRRNTNNQDHGQAAEALLSGMSEVLRGYWVRLTARSRGPRCPALVVLKVFMCCLVVKTVSVFGGWGRGDAGEGSRVVVQVARSAVSVRSWPDSGEGCW